MSDSATISTGDFPKPPVYQGRKRKMPKKSIMTPDRVSSIKSMLSSRMPMSKDNSDLMKATNKARVKQPRKKNFLQKY